MKKKIFLFLIMFLFMTNVKALTFNVNITNIEDEGNNGTIGSIEKIDIPNKELDVFFQDIGDEVNFSITISNTGNKAGTLRSIDITSTNDKIEYTTDLPENGLAINGSDTNSVTIKAKVKEGAVNGKTTSEIKINYKYDEGSCPEGEILTEDESMCLCPEGYERNENGICVQPRKELECADDEIYNESKNICEKKIIPVQPVNPKTLDNIVLITLLFIVSGLGIYAVMYKKMKDKKKKITIGVIIGVLTLGTSLTVLLTVFGLDNLLGAIVNPITRNKELVVTVNEEIELIETWDGECSLSNSNLTPNKIFEGGSGTQSDPYKIKTAEQLSCLAKSINQGTTYDGKFIKQVKNIKLNDKVLDNIASNTASNLNTWIPAGEVTVDTSNNTVTIVKSFNGTYDGDNHVISGIYINNNSADYLGLFKALDGAVIKNIILSDNYINGNSYVSVLSGYAGEDTLIDNIKTYGKITGNKYAAGILANSISNQSVVDNNKIINSENHAEITSVENSNGISSMYTNIINCKNYGNITAAKNSAGISGVSSYIIDSDNHGTITGTDYVVGIGYNAVVIGSDNYGDVLGRYIEADGLEYKGYSGIVTYNGKAIDCNNYGDIDSNVGKGLAGVGFNGSMTYNSGNTGTITAHDYNGTLRIEITGINNYLTHMITDENLSSQDFIGVYSQLMGKNFASENTKSYNMGDITVKDITAAGGISANPISSSGCAMNVNAENTGNIYITNVSTNNSSDISMIGQDGGNYTNVSSVGNIIVDHYDGPGITIVGLGTSGSGETNSYSEGIIELKNSTLTAYSAVSGGSHQGARLTNSYSKGQIKVHDNTFTGELQVGGLNASGSSSTTSYNERTIEIYNNNANKISVGGLATGGGMGVTNCYNRGNINVYDNTANTLVVVGGVTGGMTLNGGNYNSGDIYVRDNNATSITISGGGNGAPYFSNYYNLGNITYETSNNTNLTSLTVAGINSTSHPATSNLVNSGNITVPYVSSISSLKVGGVFGEFASNPVSTNLYFSGKITIGEGYRYLTNINYGNIFGVKNSDYTPLGTTPQAYYTDEGYAIGLSRLTSGMAAFDKYYGTKVDSSAIPNILSIINVNDAFEIKGGETLPTLKVFNN